MTPLVRLWLWISAFASLAGWGLSAAGELNRAGYAAAFTAFAVFVFVFRKGLFEVRNAECGMRNGESAVQRLKTKTLRRFQRALPFCFAALAVLIFLGGAIHAPGNYTGLAYRAGRVLQWLAHGGWFWIHTADYRMNDRACGIEWLSAPILLFTHSTRGLFLINFLPFLLLPGLVFSVFTRLGVRARVAWHWMWLLPTGYDFILQAGGNANDTFPAVYALAAMDFGLRARESRNIADVWHSILAAALLTGAKASNLPLLLPWALVMVTSGNWQVPRKINFTSLATRHLPLAALAAMVSFLPTAILNVQHLGDWSGLSIERAGMAMRNPLVGVWGNALLLLLDNFTPPLFPLAGWWNAHALAALPHFISAPMTANFEQGFLWLGELPTEDWAGIGFGLSVLLAVSVAAGFFVRKARQPSSLQPSANSAVSFACAVAGAARLLHEIRHGHARPAHRAILSLAAAAAAHRRGAVANRPPLLVARAHDRRIDSGVCRFDFDTGPAIVAGQNHFVRTGRAASGLAFDFPRAGGLHRLCETVRSAGRCPRAATAGHEGSRFHRRGG